MTYYEKAGMRTIPINPANPIEPMKQRLKTPEPLIQPKLQSQLFVHRITRNLSQQELADKVNVSRHTIYKIERDKAVPSVLLALRLSETLNVPVDKLFRIKYLLDRKRQYWKI